MSPFFVASGIVAIPPICFARGPGPRGSLTALFFSAVLAGVSAPAGAEFVSSYRFTGGPKAYQGHHLDLFQKYSSGFFIEGGYDGYRSDPSTSAFRKFTARAGWEGAPGVLSFFAAAVPKTDAYQAREAGADLSLNAGRGFTLTDRFWRVDLNMGLARTLHQDGVELLAERRQRGGKTARLVPFEFVQTDLTAGVRGQFEGLALSASATGSGYDKSLDNRRVRTLRNKALDSAASALEGYPRRSFSAKLSYSFAAPLRLWSSLTRTDFVLDSPSSAAVSVGTAVQIKRVAEVTLEHSRERYAGGPADSYWSAGLTLEFGGQDDEAP